MKRKLLLALAILSTSLCSMAQTYDQVSIVGPATGGWSTFVDFTTTDGVNYVLNNYVQPTLGDYTYQFVKGGSAGTWYKIPANGSNILGTLTTDASGWNTWFNEAATYNLTFNAATLAYSVVVVPLSVNSTSGIANLKSFPNPIKNVWTIQTNDEAIITLAVFNSLGSEVFTSNPNSNEVTVDTSKLSNGVYVAKVTTAKGQETIKLIKG